MNERTTAERINQKSIQMWTTQKFRFLYIYELKSNAIVFYCHKSVNAFHSSQIERSK